MSPTLAILRVGKDVRRAIGKDKPAARMIEQVFHLGLLPGAHDACDGVPVGEPHGGKAQKPCGDRKFLRLGSPTQE